MSQERNIEPTPLKRLQARQQGRFPRHAELVFLLTLALLLAIAFAQRQAVGGALGTMLQARLHAPARLALNLQTSQEIAQTALWQVVKLITWPALIGLAGVVSLLLMQGGWVWLPERLAPDLTRLQPARGIKRSADEIGRHLLFVPAKYLVGLVVALGTLWLTRAQAVTVASEDLLASLVFSGDHLFSVLLAVLFALVLVATTEYAFRLRQYHQSLKMTQQEARDEACGRPATGHVDSLQAAGDASRRVSPRRRHQATTGSGE